MNQEDIDRRAEYFKRILENNVMQLEELIKEVRETYLNEGKDKND